VTKNNQRWLEFDLFLKIVLSRKESLPRTRKNLFKKLSSNNDEDSSFFGEGNLHGRVRRDLEALEGISGGGGLDLVLELDEGDVVAARYKTDLLEAGELKETM